MERESNPMQPMCRSGCGFYGNPATDGLCSVCYKDSLRKKQTPPVSSTPVSVSSPQTTQTFSPAITVTNTAQPTVQSLQQHNEIKEKTMNDNNENSGGKKHKKNNDKSLDQNSSSVLSLADLKRSSNKQRRMKMVPAEDAIETTKPINSIETILEEKCDDNPVSENEMETNFVNPNKINKDLMSTSSDIGSKKGYTNIQNIPKNSSRTSTATIKSTEKKRDLKRVTSFYILLLLGLFYLPYPTPKQVKWQIKRAGVEKTFNSNVCSAA